MELAVTYKLYSLNFVFKLLHAHLGTLTQACSSCILYYLALLAASYLNLVKQTSFQVPFLRKTEFEARKAGGNVQHNECIIHVHIIEEWVCVGEAI